MREDSGMKGDRGSPGSMEKDRSSSRRKSRKDIMQVKNNRERKVEITKTKGGYQSGGTT